MEIGQISFYVPTVVINELHELEKKPSKHHNVVHTLNFIKKFKTIKIDGSFADREILEYVSQHNVFVATMDRELKTKIKSKGRSVISFSNDRIVLES